MLDYNALEGSSNSPANGEWTLLIQYTRNGEMAAIPIYIAFLPTGEVDLNRTSAADLLTATNLLAPSVSQLRSLTLDRVEIDIWELLNFVYVGYYWTLLADLGQVSVTNYRPTAPQPLPTWFQVNFSESIYIPSTNNIFVNASLFDTYSAYLNSTILPALNLLSLPSHHGWTQKTNYNPSIRRF